MLNAVKENGLDPEDFAWEMNTTPMLKHRRFADYFFTFDIVEYGQNQACYCPGEDGVYEEWRGGSWEGQLSLVEKWLTNLKREIQAPDLWSLLSEQTALVDAASADSPNTPFSIAEIAKIADGLRDLQAYIEDTHHLDKEKHAFLESRLIYLGDAAHRQGRQDWLHSAIGVLFTVVMGLAMAPDQAKEIFRFIGNVLETILKTPPLLPYQAATKVDATELLKFNLADAETVRNLQEYHPLLWVDCSGAAYQTGGPTPSWNPTHGSGWIVQVRPTTEAARPFGFGCLSPPHREGERQNGNLGCAPM